MPLFGHKNRDTAPVEPAPIETRGTHGRHSRTSAPRHSTSSVSDTSPKRGFFNRRRSSSVSSSDFESDNHHGGRRSNKLSHGSTRGSSGGLFHRNRPEDPSIVAARERVLSAETAERDADRALVQARAAVKEARDHAKNLEREAEEEARLAKIKQNHAKDISKRAKPLGRHDRY